ncbi:MAG: cytochrome c biogenesis CcdA family protein [Actinomycetota bacterium]
MIEFSAPTGLSTLNPCGFALLPALLSFYVGAEEKDLPRAPTRLLQALLVGVVVSAGFLAVFSIVGLPISLGARRLTEAIPWAGIILGVAMAIVGAAVFFGRRVSLSIRHSMVASRQRRPKAMFLFGAGYGVASLGCTLPVFLALIGASLASRGTFAGLAVFGAYALGMAIVLTALSLGAASLRVGLASRMRRLIPYMSRIGGAFLFVVGSYLAYYWSRARFAAPGTTSDDPLVGFVQRFTNRVQVVAASGGGRWLLLGAAVVVAVAAVAAFWRPRPRLPMADVGESRASDGEEQAARLHQAGTRP